MKLTVVYYNEQLSTLGAQTSNQILVSLPVPEQPRIKLGDRLEIHDFALDSEVTVVHPSSGLEFRIRIPARDVQDLRLPDGHGGSRVPTPERLVAAEQDREDA